MKKILTVDDSELLHRMYDLVLMRYKKVGAQILHALNGREALDRLSQHPDTDLVLLDINMPIMSGLEFLTQVKQESALAHIPVIIISTEGKEEDTILGIRKGARGYLTKPFQPNDLHALIEKLFPRAGLVGGSAGRASESPS